MVQNFHEAQFPMPNWISKGTKCPSQNSLPWFCTNFDHQAACSSDTLLLINIILKPPSSLQELNQSGITNWIIRSCHQASLTMRLCEWGQGRQDPERALGGGGESGPSPPLLWLLQWFRGHKEQGLFPTTSLAQQRAGLHPLPLLSSSLVNEEVPRKKARKWLCSSFLGCSAAELTRATDEQRGCPNLAWQRLGGHAHTRPFILPFPSSPSPGPGPLQTMDSGTLYHHSWSRQPWMRERKPSPFSHCSKRKQRDRHQIWNLNRPQLYFRTIRDSVTKHSPGRLCTGRTQCTATQCMSRLQLLDRLPPQGSGRPKLMPIKITSPSGLRESRGPIASQ